MESNEQQNADKGAIDSRIKAFQILQQDADAIRKALIEELTEKRNKLALQIRELENQRGDIEEKLGILTGEIEDAYEGPFRAKRHHIKDEVILAYLLGQGEAPTGRVQEYFAFSSATVCRRLDALLDAGKVTMEKRGTTKFWKAVA